MIQQVEAKYHLFDSLEEMLAPETMSELLSRPVHRVDCQPIAEHAGVAGSRMSYISTNSGRYFLKQMSWENDYIMKTTEDRLCRTVTLWRYGLLDELRPHLDHGIIACARDRDGWAILMEDLTRRTFAWNQPMTPALLLDFFDGLALMHAAFWNDPRLMDPNLGLCVPSRMLHPSNLSLAKQVRHPSMTGIGDWVIQGWENLPEILNADEVAMLLQLGEHPKPLLDALRRYPHTLLHGDYRNENLAYMDRLIVFDWQAAASSLMTIDVTWFTHQSFILNGMGQANAINYYRERLETHLNARFDDQDWQVMVALGNLVDALRTICFYAFFYKTSKDPKDKQENHWIVQQLSKKAMEAIRWL